MTKEPTGSAPGAKPEKASLTRDLSDFLIEFSIALNKHAMYPGGHPSLAPAVDRVILRVEPLLANRGTLSLGVARSQLVIEGVATDPKNPVLSDLAARLHRHHLGALTLRRGIEQQELREVLRLLAVEADHTGQPLGLGPPEPLAAWAHVQLFPLTYERLELIDEDEGAEQQETGEQRTRGAHLWVGLARAAMAETDEAGHADDADTDPSSVAQAIIEHPKTAAYDQVIVGYMLQIAEEVRSSGGRESAELKERMSKLVDHLDPSTLDRLLEMGGDRAQRRQFLLNASEGMAVDAVLDIVQAAGRAENQVISHSLMRMLTKLAQHAERGGGRRRLEADSTLREQVAELIEGWSLGDTTPDAYGAALSRMTEARSMYAVSPEQRFAPEPKRVLEMALEVDAMGEPVSNAVDSLADAGELNWVLNTLQEEESPTVTEAVWQQVGTPEMVGRVAAAQPFDQETLDLLLRRVGRDAAEPMLEVLAESESRQTRQALIHRIVRLGSEVGPLAAARLNDPRGHVQRNMLTIIAELPEPPLGFNAAGYLKSEDGRVRLEAIRIMLKDPAGRERAICQALTDDEERTVRIGVAAAQEGCPDTAVSLLVSRVEREADRDLRLMALRALGRSGHTLALQTLLGFAEPRRRLFWMTLPPKSPEYLAALEALRHRSDDPGAARALAAAAKSKDPEVARAATAGGEAAP
jgi:hypothetical protein